MKKSFFYLAGIVMSMLAVTSCSDDNNNTTTPPVAGSDLVELSGNLDTQTLTKDKKYLTEAQRVAKAGREHFFKNGRLPSGNYWFNAVMLRGYVDLYKIDKDKNWIDFYEEDAEAIWNKERDANNLVGVEKSKRLIDQAAMIEIYARLQQLKSGK